MAGQTPRPGKTEVHVSPYGTHDPLLCGEDSWLARSNNNTSEPGTFEARNGNGKTQRNRHKRRSNGENTEDTAVNAGFRGSKSG